MLTQPLLWFGPCQADRCHAWPAHGGQRPADVFDGRQADQTRFTDLPRFRVSRAVARYAPIAATTANRTAMTTRSCVSSFARTLPPLAATMTEGTPVTKMPIAIPVSRVRRLLDCAGRASSSGDAALTCVPTRAATSRSTRSAIRLSTRSRNDSTTASLYSGPSSRCASAAARISPGGQFRTHLHRVAPHATGPHRPSRYVAVLPMGADLAGEARCQGSARSAAEGRAAGAPLTGSFRGDRMPGAGGPPGWLLQARSPGVRDGGDRQRAGAGVTAWRQRPA